MGAVGRHLLGEPVLITYNQPENIRLLGHAQRDMKGRAVVNLNPIINGTKLDLHVFLHELSHFKVGKFKPSPVESRPTMPDKGTGSRREIYKKRESRCEEITKHWISYGRKHARPDLPEMEGILFALLSYPTTRKV